MNAIDEKAAAERIANRASETAYMSYAYSKGAYKKVVRFLLDQGLTPREAAWVVDSKHMRWAYDMGDGRATTSGTFIRYWYSCESDIRRDLDAYADDLAIYDDWWVDVS